MSDGGEEGETERICDQCGSPVPKDSPGGMCPKCLVGGVLGSESADDWLNPGPDRAGEKIGGWEILARLGEGAFGEVFHVAGGEDDPIREGALKILKSGMNSREALARFDAEREALAQLDHPNITRIFNTGETADGQPWFVMEFVDGEPVTDFCRFRELPIRERLEIFQAICEAVDHAHDQGIVHRDLKPSNVLVTTGENGEPVVKLIDFGVAKAIDMPLTQKTLFTHAGVLIGTPEYMSPEQASGKSLDLDARSDVYSLGVLLYELLTGTPPINPTRFREAAFDEVLRLVREVEAGRPSSVGKSRKITSELDWITLKALEKNRERRYADSGELGDDIRRYLEKKPVRARQPSRVYRARKFLARNRKAAIGAGVAATLIILAAATSGWLSARLTPISPDLAGARDFQPASIPEGLPDTPPPPDPEVMDGSLNQEDYAETVARLCRRLRDDPSDAHARFRLWGLLTIVPWPERIGDPVEADARITGVALFDNSARAAITSEDGIFRSLNLETGEVDYQHDCGTPLRALAVTLQLNFVAAGGENGMLYVFDFSDDENPGRSEFFSGPAPIRSLIFPENRDLFLSGDESGRLAAWSAKQGGNALWSRELGETIEFLNTRPEKDIVACGFASGEVKMFTTDSGTQVGSTIPGNGPIAGACFSSRLEEMIVTRVSGAVEIWNFATNTLREEFRAMDGEIEAFAADRLRGYFAVAGKSGEVVTHQMKNASHRRRTHFPAPTANAMVNRANQGSRLITGHADGHWRMWNLTLYRAYIDPVKMSGATSIDHLAVGTGPFRMIAAAGSKAQAWDLYHRASNSRLYEGTGFVTEAAFPAGTGLVRFMGKGGSILFDIETGKPTGQAMPIPPGPGQTAVSSDGLWIAASYENLVRVWNAPITGRAVPMREVKLDSTVTALALAPGGRYVAAATLKGSGSVWDSQTGRRLLRMKPDSATGEARSAALGDRFGAIGFQEGAVRVIDWKNGKEIPSKNFAFESAVEAVALSPDGTSVGAGDRNGMAAIFDASTGHRTDIEFTHSGGILAVGFSHDGRWLTTASRDRYGAFHDARDGRYLFRTFRWFAEMVITAMDREQKHVILMSPGAPGPSYQKLPPHQEPLPELLLDFAEAFVGFRYDENGNREEIPFPAYQEIETQIVSLPENGTEMRTWLRWLATHPKQRKSGMPGK